MMSTNEICGEDHRLSNHEIHWKYVFEEYEMFQSLALKTKFSPLFHGFNLSPLIQSKT